MPSIEMADLGLVAGRRGIWIVTSGAPPPSNIIPCNRAVRENAEVSDLLGVWNAQTREQAFCWRREWTPMHEATEAQLVAAAVRFG